MTAAPRRIRLSVVEPDWFAGLPADYRPEAERLVTLPAVELDAGAWTADEVRAAGQARGRVIACMVVDGLVTRDVSLADRTCTQLFGPRDFVSLDGLELTSLPLSVRFSAPSPARLMLVDSTLIPVAQRWPAIASHLCDAITSQLGRVSAEHAIGQLPRVEDRLLALFWDFADRWGVRRADDIVIDLPLTHEALGRLVGARRPTVSLGLGVLADSGQLRCRAHTWRLAISSRDTFSAGSPVASHPRRAPRPPVVRSSDGERLAERVEALRIEIEVGRSRVRNTLTHSRETLEHVAASRASREHALAGDR